VCVGNFTAGGTGKTPLSLLIARTIEALGAKPAFLTRGYGGRIAGPHWVSSGRDSARDVGDEPLLLANVAPTLVCRDRAAGARAIVSTGAGHGAIVMDDGLQNGALAKDLTIAVVDGRRGVGNGLVIPAGPLRAPLAFQLSLADAVVVNMAESTSEAAPESDFPDWLRRHFGGPVMRAVTRAAGDTSWIDDQPLLAFSGIGAPERFFKLVERLGGRIVERRVFADHHAFTEAEARALVASARSHGATLCTTEKDWVRLAPAGAMGVLRSEARVLSIRLELEERDAFRLKGLIEASLAARGGILA
jgi:tetraacyldisaccharide 4'-kinase